MTEQTKAQQLKAKLPCQWVEEQGFEVQPKPDLAKDPKPLTDTAFLLKSSQPPRPTRLPGS
jgi:hypothetical protein